MPEGKNPAHRRDLPGRIVRLTLAAVAAAIVLFSFVRVLSRPLRGAGLSPDQVELTVLHWGDKNEDLIVARLVADFQSLPGNQDIRIKRINMGQAAAVATKLQTMMAAGDPPDVFYLESERVADLASKGVLANIDELIDADRTRGAADPLRLEDFYAPVVAAFRYDGTRIGQGPLLGVPKDFTTLGFYYNRDLFRRAGVPEPPREGWTWDEFITAARAIGRLPGCYGADFPTWEAILRAYLFTHGVDVASPGFTAFHFDDPQVVSALQRLHSWFHDEPRTLLSAKTQLETGLEPFLAGNLGMAGPFGRWKVPTYRLIDGFDWDFAPLPHAVGREPANTVLTVAWAIASGSHHKEQAWRFVKYLCSPRGQEQICQTGLAIPVLRSVAEGPCFSDPAQKPENDEVFLRAAEVARPMEWPADPRYRDQMRVRMEEIFKLGRPVAEVLPALARAWESNRQPTLLGRSYPPMPWKLIAGWILIPLALVVAAALAAFWLRRPPRLAFQEELAGWGMIAPWLIGFAAFTAFPVALSLLLSLTRWSGLRTLDYAELVWLDNYRELLAGDPVFRKSLRVTAWYALLAVPSSQIAALIAALLLNQEIRGVPVYRAIWYLPSVLAGVGMAVMWKWVFHHEHGLLKRLGDPLLAPLGGTVPAFFEKDAESWAVPAFVVVNLWCIGGTMMIYLAGLKGISAELYEAAEIDGAGGWMRFRHVTLPMLSPVIFFNVIMAIIASFQVFTQAYVMTGGGPGTATHFYVFYLYKQAFDLHQMGYASAMAWLLLLIVLTLTLVVMRGSRRLVYYEALRG